MGIPSVGILDDIKIVLNNTINNISVEQSDKTKLKTTSELSAGSALIGKVSIDQTTANANEVVVKLINAGDSNIGNVDVVTLPTIPSGTNIIGRVGIDQTNDGTTNKVQVRNSDHDNLQCNANMQKNNTDVSMDNPINTSVENTDIIAIAITLVAGETYTLKATPGYIYGINTGILDDCYLVNGVTQVWLDDYQGNPFYCDTSIKFVSATGGNIFIIYR